MYYLVLPRYYKYSILLHRKTSVAIINSQGGSTSTFQIGKEEISMKKVASFRLQESVLRQVDLLVELEKNNQIALGIDSEPKVSQADIVEAAIMDYYAAKIEADHGDILTSRFVGISEQFFSKYFNQITDMLKTVSWDVSFARKMIRIVLNSVEDDQLSEEAKSNLLKSTSFDEQIVKMILSERNKK